MKKPATLPGLAGALALGVVVTTTLLRAQASPDASPSAARLERGRTIVFRTGLCIDCHSPRDERGEHLETKHLTGAPIPFAPLNPMPWMAYAPRLAGGPKGFTREEFIHFLMTGERPNGRGHPLPPMPPYRFERADAEAIADYLRSLPPQ